jgi:small GTP-binding protein
MCYYVTFPSCILLLGHGSIDLSAKTNYRILVLGANSSGKTSIVRQFLYDKFNPKHTETMDDMYRGEFEDANGRLVNFDIQDVGGAFVYEFPAMRSVSLAQADAFLLVFSLDNAESWEEVNRLRDMVREAKVSLTKMQLTYM